jgi:DNA (cytosine-5)-methyltransferase 1
MRCATDGRYPKIAIFENVPGVLSVDRGHSYKTIIEAFCETEIPMPASGKWANAGMVRGGSVDFAWVCKDSQHYRVPQRRKRLLAVADFTGRRAAEILFESESLSGYFAARERARQGTPGYAESGADGAGGGILSEKKVAAFMAGQAKNARSIAYNETLSPTLKGSASGLNQTPCVLCMATGQSDGTAATGDISHTLTPNLEAPHICKEQVVYGICSKNSNSMLSDNPFSGIYEAATCRTLDRSCANPACNQGGIAVVEGSFPCEPQIARTLTARHDSSPCADRGQNIVAFAQNQRDEVRDLNGVAGCLAAEPGMKQQTYIYAARDDGECNALPLTVCRSKETHPCVAGTLCASGAGMSRPAGNANETDLCVAYCLQGNMIGRADCNGPQGKGVNAEVSFTLNATDHHAVAYGEVSSSEYKEGNASTLKASGGSIGGGGENLVVSVDCRNMSENEELSGTLQSKFTGGYSLNYQNPVRAGYVIRRLTPTECERLMAFDDGYTETGHDGKVMSDSARYQMLGNSIVVNVLAYIMQNAAKYLAIEESGVNG